MSDAAENMVNESEDQQEQLPEGSKGMLNPSLESDTDQEQPNDAPHLFDNEASDPIDESMDWGERPEFMSGLEQFWSEEEGPDIEGMAKSYQELRSKMSAGKHKAPKDGNYDIASLKDHGVAEDDAMLNDFSKFAAESGLSQDQFDQITSIYMQHVGEMLDQNETNKEAEMARLGPKADKIIGGLNQWLTKLGNSGALSSEEVDAIASKADNRDYIMALNKIRESYGERSIPDISIQEGNSTTLEDLQSMLSDPKYGKDMGYTNMVERKFYEFHGEA